MSSFIGHGLAGLTVYAIDRQLPLHQKRIVVDTVERIAFADGNRTAHRQNWLWAIWLVTIASIPDIDYLIPVLRLQQPDRTIRITHSLIGVLLFPAGSILFLWLSGDRGKSLQIKSLQLFLAGGSHLLFDLLTGVFPEPLLYPFSTQTFRLPFGLLPSAGKIQLTNFLFYRNLSIEMGVLMPLSISLLISKRDSVRPIVKRLCIVSGLLVSGCFMSWAASLSR